MDSGKGKEISIGVIGAGAIGSILSAHLIKAGREVILIESSPRGKEIRKNGLSITGITQIHEKPKAVLESVEKLESHPVKILFICTKTTALKDLLPALKQHLKQRTIIVSFQNGIDVEDEIAHQLPDHGVVRAIVNFAGAVSRQNGATQMAWFNPPNFIGAFNDQTQAAIAEDLQNIADCLDQSGLKTQKVSRHEMKKKAFLKAILNSALSPLCAVSGITMRHAMTYPHTNALVTRVLREGLAVAFALGYKYESDIENICMQYLQNGGDHHPSMWMDLQNKTRTEIEYINGKIIEIAAQYSELDVSANIFLTTMILTEEIKSGARHPDDIPEYLRYR